MCGAFDIWNLVLFQLEMKTASVAGGGQWQGYIILFLASAVLQLEVPHLEVVCVAGDRCVQINEFKHGV